MLSVPSVSHDLLKSRGELLKQVVKSAVEHINDAINKRGTAFVGLSSSNSLLDVYAALGESELIEWPKVMLFAVDESFVPDCVERSGETLRAARGSFRHCEKWQFVFPRTSKAAGVEDCCRDYEHELENTLLVPDVVFLTVEKYEAQSAGLCAPIPTEAFDKERLAVSCRVATEFVPFRICTSLSFLRTANALFFVLPTQEQVDTWGNVIIGNKNGLHEAERIRAYAAASLITHPNVRIFSAFKPIE